MSADVAPALSRSVTIVAAFAVSALVTWLAIRYAHRRGLVDLPGQRRSHTTPTPRGGGIGIVAAAITTCLFVQFAPGQANDPLCLVIALALVAAIGWIDDHRGLGALPRIAAHALAGAILLAPWLARQFSAEAGDASVALASALFCIAWFGCVWSINLHNFMDGINGLLAAQAIFALAALGVLCAPSNPPHALVLFAWAAAALAFLPFNFPRAHIFMGDVGSGTLGLMIAVGVLWQMAATDTAPGSGLIACSVFVTDASCTLLSRICTGRRWYSAHREHLYQWLVRSGFGHAAVVVLYLCWNFAVVVPVLYLANRSGAAPADGWIGLGVIYTLAVLAWIGGKRWCLRHARRKRGSV